MQKNIVAPSGPSHNLQFQGPIHVDFNLTNGCNLACSHCHSSSGNKLDFELNFEEVVKATKDLHSLGALSIAYAGGEPFIRRDIVEILKYACELPGWSVSVITNGFYFKEKSVLTSLAKLCPGLTVNISLDGSTAEQFHLLRRQVSNPHADPSPLFTRIVNGIRSVVDMGIQASVNFTLTRVTIEDLLPTYHFAISDLGVQGMVAIKFFPGGYGKRHLGSYELPFRIWNTAFSELTSLKIKGELDRMQISVPAPWEFYLPIIEAGIDVETAERAWAYRSPLRERTYSATREIGDIAGVAELCISGDGLVYPSVLLTGERDMACGDLRKQSLREIWEASSVLKALRFLKLNDLSGGCGTCVLNEVCGGGSRSRAYSRSACITDADYTCPILPNGPDERVSRNKRNHLPPSAVTHAGKECFDETHKTEVTVFETGAGVIRVIRKDIGCEIRFLGHVISCSEDLFRILNYIATSDRDRRLLSQRIGTSKQEMPERVLDFLEELRNMTIPLSC